MKCGPDGNFTNMFLADGKYQNLSMIGGGGTTTESAIVDERKKEGSVSRPAGS
jgi:hypothetical protein